MKKNKIVTFVIFFTCTVFAQNIPPKWLADPTIRYNKNLYIVSLGSGSTRKIAEKDALARMALIFESKVNVNNTLIKNYEERTNEDVSTLKKIVLTNDKTHISSKQNLINVKFGESYTDPNHSIHVLAYIDRMETIEIYNKKIIENDNRFLFYLNKGMAYLDPIKKYSYIRAAFQISKENEKLLNVAAIINPGFVVSPKGLHEYPSIKDKMLTQARKVTFSINITNDEDYVLSKSLKQLLTELGFVVKKNALLTISGKFNIHNLTLPRKGKFANWNLSLDLFNNRHNLIFSTTKDGREGHITKIGAWQRCKRSAKHYILNNYYSKILSYFDEISKFNRINN